MEDNNNKIKEASIAELEEYVKVLRSNREYSMSRLDTLLVSICGAGVYTSFEIMKYVSESKILKPAGIAHCNYYYKITALLFTLAIMANFFSQWTAYKSSSYFINAIKGESLNFKEITNVDVEELQGIYKNRTVTIV